MKKIFTLAAIMLLCSTAVNAQNYVNAGAGCCFENLDLSDNARKYTTVFAEVSHNFALAGNFGVEAGIGYVDCFNVADLSGAIINSKIKFDYGGLMLPVEANYKFDLANGLALKVFAGPTFNYGLSYKTTTIIEDKELSVIDSYENGNVSRFMAAATAGVGVEFSNFRIKADYQYDINDLYKTDLAVQKNNFLTLSVGFAF